jgi:peptidoglycan/LPS O-acetylase OafA/YrhL
MGTQRTLVPVVFAAVSGAALWVAASVVTGRREPWDASIYWSVFYPLALLVCGLLGYLYPGYRSRSPFVLFAFQFLAMCALDRELGSLWPLGMVLFAVLALPGVIVSRLGARLGTRLGRDVA